MHRAIASLMALLVVHLQVAVAACLCVEQGDGHAHAHAGPTRHHECHHHGHSHPSVPSDPSAPDNDRAPHCECPPTQPFTAQDAPQVPGRERATGVLPLVGPVAAFVLARVPPDSDLWAHYPRPPPLLRGVSSASPMSLPVLLN